MTKDFFDELDNEISGISPEKSASNTLPSSPKEDWNTIPQTTKQNSTQTSQNTHKTEYTPRNQRPPQRNPEAPKSPQHQKPKSQTPNTHKTEYTHKTAHESNTKPRNDKPKNNFRRESQAAFNPVVKSEFPQVKFYLPPLRENFTRMLPVGGNNETGAKNMDMFQFKDDIILIDCGIQFAEPDMLGVTCSVPDISFLIPYKKNIKALIVTHAHLDHIGALKHILPALDFPVIYATKLTIGIIKKGLEEHRIAHLQRCIEVNTDSDQPHKIGEYFQAEFFRVNHSVPDCMGVYLKTPGNFTALHTGDFKIDFAPQIDKPADLARIWEYGRRGVTLFMSDSTGSTRKGFSQSEKAIGETLDKMISSHKKGRLIITIFSSWISRVQQIINTCERTGKYVFLSGRSMVENVAISKELGYITAKPGTIKKMSPKTTQWVPLDRQVIITTGSQWEEFSALTRMAEGKHNSIEIMKGDTIIFSSSVVPGNERSVVWVINKLIKLGANVITKDDGEVHTGGHAFQEEQKIMINLTCPKYFVPIYGDLYFRHVHKNTAMSVGMKEENILLLDNGHIVDFSPEGKAFRHKVKAPIQDIIIDGSSISTTTSHVIKARDLMMTSGVLVILFQIDKKTKALIGNIKIESRWLLYLDEVRIIHKMIVKKAQTIFENTIKDVPEIEEKELVKLIKTDLESFLVQKIDRTPMIIPMIIEL